MAHGYLGDGYGSHGEIEPDRGDHDWRERNMRNRGQDWRNGDGKRSMMLRGRGRDWSNDDRARRSGSWRESGGFAGSRDFPEGERNFSPNPDDHYRSWRDRHMSELDRDYADFCREREQQFHSDFDDWRGQKYGNPQPLQTGMPQTGMSHDPSGEFELTNEASIDPSGSDPIADATLGTNSTGTRGGRSRR